MPYQWSYLKKRDNLNANKPDTPGNWRVFGFHTFFFDPNASPTTRWVIEFASWISPGIFANPDSWM